MIGKTISHYKILSKIGEGGRGVVYKAEDTDLNRIVALKFISPHLADNAEDLKSLYDEARSASQLNHPNITTIYEIGHSGKFNFIVMEYMDGKTLKDKIKREVLTTDEILDIAKATLDGIEAAHEQNIIHRDIKSENIMVSETGSAKVMDFGLAKNLNNQNVTKVSKTLGTIAYMSPEQIEGSKVDQRSDIYSFGVVLYEMVTGRLPFIGEHEAATLYSIVNEAPPSILSINTNVNSNLVAIIEKAIEKKPDDRYQNATELLNDLSELKTGKFKPLAKQILPTRFIPKSLKSFWIAGGIVGLLIIVAGLITFLSSNDRNNSSFISSLAVLNFDNIQNPDDPTRLGQILQELIIADLSDISTLKVFSSQRLFDIQKQLGSDNRKSIDPTLATSIAKVAGAETMLTGNVISRGNNLILSSQLINTEDGAILKSHQVEGNDIYVMVDNLTSLIQADMNLPLGSEEPIGVAVADKTTSSVNAFQYYFDGIDYFNRSHFKEAIVEFKNAISIDSTFSNAYYKLALSQWWSQSEMDEETIDNAKSSLQKILNGSWYRTTKEKLLAQGALALTNQNFIGAEDIYLQLIEFISDEKEAWYGLGEAIFHGSMDLERASSAFERAVELDPEFTIAYRHIFDIYHSKEEYDAGIIRATQLIDRNADNAWGQIFLGQMLVGKENYLQAKLAFEEALQLDPDSKIIYKNLSHVYNELELFDDGITFAQNLLNTNITLPEAYGFLAYMYLGKNNILQAIQTYRDALRDNPNSYKLNLDLAKTLQINGQYNQSINQYNEIARIFPEQWNSSGQHSLSNIYMEQGKYNEVIDIIQAKMAAFNESDINAQANSLNSWAYCSALLGDFATAEAKLDLVFSSDTSNQNKLIAYLIKGVILYEQNNSRELDIISQNVGNIIGDGGNESINRIIYQAILLMLSHTKGEYNSVLTYFDNMDDRIDLKYRFYPIVIKANIELGRHLQALELIQKMRKPNISVEERSFAYPRSFYYEGLVNESLGNFAEAKQNYQTLLNIWSDGDAQAIDFLKVQGKYNNL